MAIQLFKSEVSKIRHLTHDVKEITFRLLSPAEISFKAGQFISFEITQDGLKYPLMRPYSIASSPSQKQAVELVLNLVPGGPGSTYLFNLQEGDLSHFKGPAGTFYLREDPNRDYVFVATGTGIGPLRSMIMALFEKGTSRSVILYWGLRSERDLFYQDEFKTLAAVHPNFTFVITLSKPHDKNIWRGPTGRVTSLIEQQIHSVSNMSVYLCGNSGMIKDVTDVLNQKGLCPIYREKFYDDFQQ